MLRQASRPDAQRPHMPPPLGGGTADLGAHAALDTARRCSAAAAAASARRAASALPEHRSQPPRNDTEAVTETRAGQKQERNRKVRLLHVLAEKGYSGGEVQLRLLLE